MSLFSRTPDTPTPQAPKDFPSISGCSPEAQAFLQNYINMWQQETATLSRLNLPVPKITRGMLLNYEEEYVPKSCNKWFCKDPKCQPFVRQTARITDPSFAIPSHLIVSVIPYNRTAPHNSACGLLLANPDTLEEATKTLKDRDIISFVEKYPVRWFSRNPYALYKLADEENRYFGRGRGTWDEVKPRFDEYKFPKPLQEVPWYSLDELRLAKGRLQMLLACGYGIITKPQLADILLGDYTYIGYREKIELRVTDALLQRLPLPDRTLPKETITFKVLPDLNTPTNLSEQFLDSLRQLTEPATFSIIAQADTIYFQLSCAPKHRALIEHQLRVHFPNFSALDHTPLPSDDMQARITAAPGYTYQRIKTARDFSLDPYSQLFATLMEMPARERADVHIHFVPMQNETIKMVCDDLQQTVNEPSPEINTRVKELQRKLPSWLVRLSIEATHANLLEKLQQRFLNQYQTPQQSWIINDLSEKPEAQGIFNILDTSELASLAHFPEKGFQCDILETASMKSKLPPDLYTGNGIKIGTSTARGQTKDVHIPLSVRDRHTYVVGKSGTGKSTLLYNCICQDIDSGSGVAVIDPHGDLVEDVLKYIPESRVEDTIYFNAGDKQYPISLNILNAENDDEIGLLADDLLVTFKRISESWGERMDTILRYTFHTMLRVQDTTLLDLINLFQNLSYRQRVISQIESPLLLDFWQQQYPNYPKDAAQPILNRLAKFSLSPILSGILGQSNSNLNFFDVIQNRKILLVNLSKGIIGEDSAQLLGSLIVSQLQLAIMRRAALPKETRDPYFLYVDEFQNFTTSAFEKILSEARKYKLCLTLAHQYISQLDEKTKNAILANIGTIIMFQSYPADANALRAELGQYEPADVTNLNTAEHQALCKPNTQSKDTFMFQTMPPLKSEQSFVSQIIEFTRENYSEGPQEKAAATQASQPDSTPLPQARKLPPIKQPIRALEKEFASAQDKILHYVTQADWLATSHIHTLCYSHLAESAKKSVASRDLKALTESKRIKSTVFGSGKIYYSGRACSPTNHNRAIRDLYTKILASGYEVAAVNFSPDLKTLRPDLEVSFLAADGSFIKTFWEYDAGTEDVADLVHKVSRYSPLATESLITFVFNSEERLQLVKRTIKDDFITVAVLDQFFTLDDAVFRYASDDSGARAYFALD